MTPFIRGRPAGAPARLVLGAMLASIVSGCQAITALDDFFSADKLPNKTEMMQAGRPEVDLAAVNAANDRLGRLSERAGPLMQIPPRPHSGVLGEISYTPAVPTPAALTAPASSPPAGSGPGRGQGVRSGASSAPVAELVELDLVNASLRAVVELMFGEYLKRPYTILPDFVEKQVNWLVSGRYMRDEMLRMFETFLDAHGVYFLDTDGVFTVSGKPIKGIPGGLATVSPGQTLGVWRIENLDVKDLLPIAKQFLGNPDRMHVLDVRNILIAAGAGPEIRQIDLFISRIDTPFFHGKSIIVYGPRFLTPTALAALLATLPRNLGTNLADPKKPIDVDIVPGESRLVIVLESPQLKEVVMRFIEQVDRIGFHDRQVFFLPLRNQKAEEIRVTVDGLITPLFADRVKPTIQASVATNSLLITATPDEFYEIKKVVDTLDFKIPSVLIDAAIVEVQLRDSLAYGVQWFLSLRRRSIQGDISTNLANRDVIPIGPGATGGVSIGAIALNDNAFATIDLLASQTNLRVLSRPRVLVQNSLPAKIKSTDQIRVVKSVLATAATVGGSSLPQREFIDKEVGVSLEVTPTIADDGTVSMKLKISDSRQGASDLSSGEPQPTFNVREVDTTLLVPNGETILIGGLIRNTIDRREQKIPWLGDLPLIGKAFANTSDKTETTELIVLITPYVVLDRHAARIVTDAIAQSGLDLKAGKK
ncbi:MAG: type II secretion system protein GspD [Pseudomonadota bacterium]